MNEICPIRSVVINERHLTIRPLTDGDLKAVNTVEQRSHEYPWRLEHIRSSLAHHICLGLFSAENDLNAYAILSHILDEVELLLFVVDCKRQHRGLGKFFLSHLTTEFAKRARSMFLEVRRSNVAAISLYENCGFNQIGIRPAYYPSGKGTAKSEDALIFASELCLDL